jgi:hypothetical protein
MASIQLDLQYEKLIDFNNCLTKLGNQYNKSAFDLMENMGLTVNCHSLSANNNKKIYNYFGMTMIDKLTGKYIKHKSYYTSLRNCLHILTGELHGGFIGIDVDVKGKSGIFSDLIYRKMLINSEKIERTLTCKTPSGGYHYVYKLNDEQKKALKGYKIKQPKLFDCDIDVLYNSGRFVMSGAYLTDGKFQKIYRIIDDIEPTILPNIVFQEIISKTNKNKQSKIANAVCETKPILNYSECCETDKNLINYLNCLKNERCEEYAS